MRARFSQSFKIQAVEKALNPNNRSSQKDLSESLGIGYSTLQKWVRKSREQAFDIQPESGFINTRDMMKEKRPQDWSPEEKLNMVITCAGLSEEKISQLCREQGLYPHHIKQWKADFLSEKKLGGQAQSPASVKSLRAENKALKKELNRKDKALAETAALLVLQKKVRAIWGSDEDSSQ
jgi:transposase-like protein